MRNLFLLFNLLLAGLVCFAQQQQQDKGVMQPAKNEFYENMEKASKAFFEPPAAPTTKFMMDYTGKDIPKSVKEFTIVGAGEPVLQAMTNTCWSFSTTSFFESEIQRLYKKQVRLSEMYIVYWEYVDKAAEWVKTRGNMFFGEGSEANANLRVMRKYGAMPQEAFTGMKIGQPYHDHVKMFEEIKSYLNKVKENQAWDDNAVVNTVKAILHHHIGTPPTNIVVEGKTITPVEYMKNVIKINPDDYVDFMSLVEYPYYTKAEFKVPDNWWHDNSYHNIPLDVFMTTIKTAIKSGYTIAIGGDVSESGYNGRVGVAMVPSFDIPSQYINEYARQFRFSNKTSTDDHGVHLIGWMEKKTDKGIETWFLIKDSASGSHLNSEHPGYYFYHEDYVKLKMLSFTLHKDAAKEILKNFK